MNSTEALYDNCDAVGICPKTDEPHWFYWDCDRDTERMTQIHDHGAGHADPLSKYGAVMCRHCDCKALVLSDADDFPEV